MISTQRHAIRGIRDLMTICTSHVERCNLTIRTFMRRFTRLALGFSKKLANLDAAAALHIAHYNFVRHHRTLQCTPAMAAGLVPDLWKLERLYDEVTDLARKDEMTLRTERLIRTMGRKQR